MKFVPWSTIVSPGVPAPGLRDDNTGGPLAGAVVVRVAVAGTDGCRDGDRLAVALVTAWCGRPVVPTAPWRAL